VSIPENASVQQFMRTLGSPLRVSLLVIAALSQPMQTWAGQDRVSPLAGHAGEAPIEVRGGERLAWDQQASSAGELSRLGFLAYVNGRVQWLYSVSCASAPSAAGFECSAALPVLDPGVNMVEVAAYRSGAPAAEGLRSPPFYLRLGGATAGPGPARAATSAPSAARTWTTADGVQLQATELASGLDDPTDLLPLPDGRVLIAERGGRLRVYRDGALSTTAAAVLNDVAGGAGRGLLALTADRAFASTQHVFTLYTAAEGLRVARFTLAGDRLVDRAIVIDGLPIGSDRPAAVLRTGPDGRLYLALDDGGDPQRLGDRGSYSGKVLRFAVDGTTPADQSSPSPIWSIGVSRPVGLAWSADAATPRLIGVESAAEASARAQQVGPDSGAAVTRLSLTPEVGATRAALGGDTVPAALRGDLLVASGHEHAILRIRLEGDTPALVEWLVQDLPGPATALAVAPDGSIYAAVGSTLIRISGQ
jgi:glucose/arabinose dehydrogenase